jgi:hypothetical protein
LSGFFDEGKKEGDAVRMQCLAMSMQLDAIEWLRQTEGKEDDRLHGKFETMGKDSAYLPSAAILPKASTEAANWVCYAERFCLSTQYGILGGNFPSNNS